MEPVAAPSAVPSYAAALIRAGLTAAGGWAVSHGYLQSDQVSQLVGAALVIIAVLWSLLQKRDAHVAMKTAAVVINTQAAQLQGTSADASPPSSTAGG